MKKFKVVYGVGGGYNDIQEEVLEFSSRKEAEEYAYESAVNIFDSYSIFEEHQETDEECDEEEYEYLYNEEVERWCSYYAEELPES